MINNSNQELTKDLLDLQKWVIVNKLLIVVLCMAVPALAINWKYDIKSTSAVVIAVIATMSAIVHLILDQYIDRKAMQHILNNVPPK